MSTFKEMVDNDLDAVFFDGDEFAGEIEVNGQVMTGILDLTGDRIQENPYKNTNIVSLQNLTGMLIIKASDMTMPNYGDVLRIRETIVGEVKMYQVETADKEDGVLYIGLTGNDGL